MGSSGIEPIEPISGLFRNLCMEGADFDRVLEEILTHKDFTPRDLATLIIDPDRFIIPFGTKENEALWKEAADQAYFCIYDHPEWAADLTILEMVDIDEITEGSTDWWERVMEKADKSHIFAQLEAFHQTMQIPREERSNSRWIFARQIVGYFNIPDSCNRARLLNKYFKDGEHTIDQECPDDIINEIVSIIEEDVKKNGRTVRCFMNYVAERTGCTHDLDFYFSARSFTGGKVFWEKVNRLGGSIKDFPTSSTLDANDTAILSDEAWQELVQELEKVLS